MVWGRVQTAVKVGAGALALAQVATIGALMVVDRRRKRQRGHVKFPSKRPAPLWAGEDELTVYTRGRDLFDDMIATIDAAQHTIFLETYIWKGDRVGRRFKQALADADWPVQGRARWRLGEVTVPWSTVAPALTA